MFRPKIGNYFIECRNIKNEDIGDFLYKQKDKYSASKKALITQELSKLKEESTKTYFQKKSQFILEQKKLSLFHQIFSTLDYFEEGKLSRYNINIECINLLGLPIIVQKCFQPLFIKIKTNYFPFLPEDFIKESNKIFNKLSISDKSKLLHSKLFEEMKNTREPKKISKLI